MRLSATHTALGPHRLLAELWAVCGAVDPTPPSAHPRCECAPGYVGDNCTENRDDCEDHRCQNGAQCVDGVNGYSCLCAEGYR